MIDTQIKNATASSIKQQKITETRVLHIHTPHWIQIQLHMTRIVCVAFLKINSSIWNAFRV